MSKEKPPVVNFVRHVRVPYFNSGLDPLKGMTIAFELDYVNQTVSGWISCCNGENFVKSLGIELATEKRSAQNPDFSFQMKGSGGGVSEGGVVQDLLFSDEFDDLKPIYKDMLLKSYYMTKAKRKYFKGLCYDENGIRKPF